MLLETKDTNLKNYILTPMTLNIRGTFLPQDNNSVAIVGTRQPTDSGLNKARNLGTYFAIEGITVISGLAWGIDREAALGVIDGLGRQIAVLSTPVSQITPKANKEIGEAIIDNGCLVSAYPEGTRYHVSHYIERDRLIAGLSKVVIVVECGIESGTMHTVKAALELKIPVFVCKGSPGTEFLLANNLAKECNVVDVMTILGA